MVHVPAALRRLAVLAGLALLLPVPATPATAACGWREPARSYPEGARWRCAATRWADGDTFTAECGGGAGAVAVRVRGVDTAERGEAGWREARGELRRRTEGRPLDVLPHHPSRRRVAAAGAPRPEAAPGAGLYSASLGSCFVPMVRGESTGRALPDGGRSGRPERGGRAKHRPAARHRGADRPASPTAPARSPRGRSLPAARRPPHAAAPRSARPNASVRTSRA